MRPIVALVGLALAAPAHAGGLGLLFTGGAHTEQTWFYTSYAYPEGGGDPVPYENLDDYEQYQVNQTLANFGGGAELLLGDRDRQILGSFRFFYMQDAPEKDPRQFDTAFAEEHKVASYRETPRHIGMGMIGLNWGILGDPGGFQFGVSGHVGSGFLTTDHTEFLAYQIGPTVSYQITRPLEVFAEAVYQGRFRKRFSHGGSGYAGVRYYFD